MPDVDDQTVVQDPAEQVEEKQVVDPELGHAGEGETPSEVETTEEGQKLTRNERRHERFIDKLSNEIQLGKEISGQPTSNLFPVTTPYQPLPLQDGGEYDPKQLEDDRNQFANSKMAEGYQRGLSQGTTRQVLENFETKLDIDKDKVAAKWKALDNDPDNALYDDQLEQSLVQQYVAFTGMEKDAQGRLSIQRPNVRFKDFVDAQMLNMERYASSKHTQSSENVHRQAANTGLRPNGQIQGPKKGHGFDGSSPDAAAQSVRNMTSEQYHKLGGKEASDAYLAKRGIGA